MNRFDERRPRFWRHSRDRDEHPAQDPQREWRGNEWPQSGEPRRPGPWSQPYDQSPPYGQREPYNARGGSSRSRWGGPWNDDSSRYSESQYGVGKRRTRFDAYGGGYEPEFGEGPFADTSEAPGYFGTGHYGEGGAHYTGGFDQRSRPRNHGSLAEDPFSTSGQPHEQRRYRTGPKGYTRSDDRIREDISERLMMADSIDSSEVTVSVQEGRVTLEGTVPTRSMKHAIEDLADYTAGVQDVDNRIRVERAERQQSAPPVAPTSKIKQ